MQQPAKFRILGLLCSLFCAGAIAYNWHLLISEGRYYLQASGMAPIGALLGLVLLFSPSEALRSKTGNKKSIAIFLIIGIIGMVLGDINFSLVDHYR